MKIDYSFSISNFEFWSGAEDIVDILTDNEIKQLDFILETMYPDGLNEEQLNDIFRFEEDWIAQLLGYRDWEDLESDR